MAGGRGHHVLSRFNAARPGCRRSGGLAAPLERSFSFLLVLAEVPGLHFIGRAWIVYLSRDRITVVGGYNVPLGRGQRV